jgi:hypothetical protein
MGLLPPSPAGVLSERGDREWKQAQRQGDFLDNSSTQKTKGGPKLVLSPKDVTALRPLKDRHQFFYIVRYQIWGAWVQCCSTLSMGRKYSNIMYMMEGGNHKCRKVLISSLQKL